VVWLGWVGFWAVGADIPESVLRGIISSGPPRCAVGSDVSSENNGKCQKCDDGCYEILDVMIHGYYTYAARPCPPLDRRIPKYLEALGILPLGQLQISSQSCCCRLIRSKVD
jgi:hypothetical protein